MHIFVNLVCSLHKNMHRIAAAAAATAATCSRSLGLLQVAADLPQIAANMSRHG